MRSGEVAGRDWLEPKPDPGTEDMLRFYDSGRCAFAGRIFREEWR